MSTDADHVELATPDQIASKIHGKSRELLVNYIERHSDPVPCDEKSSRKVTKSMCELIHQMYDDGTSPSDIADVMPVSSPNTIYYHLRRDCTHEYRSQLTYSECGWMRVKADQGAPSSTLAMLYNVRQDVATLHITGRCQHEDGIEPVSGEQLRSNAYSGPELTTSICPVCEEEFEHRAYRDRTTCSTKCNSQYASNKSKEKVKQAD